MEDFRWKFLTDFWIHIRDKKCALCGEDFSPDHLLVDCKVVRSWERHADRNEPEPSRRRRIRKENMYKRTPDHLYSWLSNWSIWKCYWDVVFGHFDNPLDLNSQTANLISHLREHEKLHLKVVQLTKKNPVHKKVSLQTTNFRFFKWDNGAIKEQHITPAPPKKQVVV